MYTFVEMHDTVNENQDSAFVTLQSLNQLFVLNAVARRLSVFW